jgi:hypothetical protein
VETAVEATAMSMNMSTHAATNTSMSTHTVAVVIGLARSDAEASKCLRLV